MLAITGNPLKLFISYLDERSGQNVLAIQEIHSSCLFHTLTRDLVKCVGNTGNPLSVCLFHTLTRDLVKCVGNTGNPLKLFISYLNERSGKMCWQYRESSQVVYFIP